MQAGLALGGLVPFSTADFPGRLAAVLFTQGCPLRCRYCHNAHLRPRAANAAIDWYGAMAWLRSRQGLLDGVVISGGEPTIQPQLGSALQQIRELGFAAGLHTAGVHPRRLAGALPLLDWIGLDFKAPFARYSLIAGTRTSGERARAALDLVAERAESFEIRTTLHAALLSEADLLDMARELRNRGIARWTLQIMRPQGCEDAALRSPSRPEWLDAALHGMREIVSEIRVREGSSF
jgi:pyruvate formate lyase activating enzyme